MADTGRAVQWSWDAALSGVVPPLISSLDAAGRVDEAAVAALVGRVLGEGATGLFMLGGCGEGAWLTSSQRGAVVKAAVKAAAGRAPVLAGVMLPGTGAAAEAARQAVGEGADAVIVGSPYYFGVDGDAQARHIEAVIEAAGRPALLYNIPQCTHHTLAPAVVDRLARDARVLGIKDSAGDFQAFQEFVAVKGQRGRFRVLQGNEPLAAASLLLGGDGLVPGVANVAAAVCVELSHAAARADAAACAKIQERINDLAGIYAQGPWLPALKAACALVGIGNGNPAPPLVVAAAGHRAAVEAILRRQGLLGGRA